MDVRKIEVYGRFVSGVFVNALAIGAMVLSRDTKWFWIFILILFLLELYGVYSVTLGPYYLQQEDLKKIPPWIGKGIDDEALAKIRRDISAYQCTNHSPINRPTVSSGSEMWYASYMGLSNTLLYCRNKLGELPEETEAHFSSIADLLWSNMNEKDRELADQQTEIVKGLYDSKMFSDQNLEKK